MPSTYFTRVNALIILLAASLLLMEHRDKSPFSKGGFRGNVKMLVPATKKVEN